jgi:hypothetical protein
LISTAAKVARAAPSEWPVTNNEEMGYLTKRGFTAVISWDSISKKEV